jgi:MarR family transcriptional regulator, organic hydroperoxide resistance regulator
LKLTFKDYISIRLHKTDLNLTNLIKSKLEPYNLAPEQNLIMMLLWEQEGLTQYQLVEYLNKDKTNIARMASSLESKGFITKVHCQNDRRSVKLYLTEKGKSLGKSVIPILEEFNSIVTSGITDEELAQLERILTKMNNNVLTQI